MKTFQKSHSQPVRYRVKNSFELSLNGAPTQVISPCNRTNTVALLGTDYPNLRPNVVVDVGDTVKIGDALFADRKRPEIIITSPVSGVITAIRFGPRRTLDLLTIEIKGEQHRNFKIGRSKLSRDGAMKLLLESGLWVSFLERPFGRIPDPKDTPAAIFVKAIETDPLAVDPLVVIATSSDEFNSGLEALKEITSGPVFLCQAPGEPVCNVDQQIQIAEFSGGYSAGLAGTHIHHLFPVSANRSVWQIGYQDVIELGRLLKYGQLSGQRTISIAGSGAQNPRLVETTIGANLEELLDGELHDNVIAIKSGSLISGQKSEYLGRFHNQITILGKSDRQSQKSVLSRISSFCSPASAGPLVPSEKLDAVSPAGVLAVPLMRALSIGDEETALQLGCLELLEEDVAPLSTYCTGRTRLSSLLRSVLDKLAGKI